MNIHLYWISAITYAIIIGMILLSELRRTKLPSKVEHNFRLLAVWVLFFCLQDTVWGLCDAHVIKNDTLFFISSSVFHISTVATTFFWLKYVLEYLDEEVKHKKIYLILDGVVIGFELVLVVLNFFRTTLFTIVDGKYVTGFLRPLTFVNQYAVYLLTGIITLLFAIKKKSDNNAHYHSVFFFTLAPILLGIFQLLYPSAPFYSLGYFLGFFIVHIFVIAKDREEYFNTETQFKKILDLNNELESKQHEIDMQFDILKSISGVYDAINLIDLKEYSAKRFDLKNSEEDFIDIENDPHTKLNKNMMERIVEDDSDRFWQFTDISTLEKRMLGEKLISSEFVCKDGEWIRAMYIRIGDDVNKQLSRVAYTLQDITADRRREHQVYNAIANLVYSLHIFDIENDTMERLIESDILKKLVGNEESGQRMANILMHGTCREEYLELMLEFVDFSTITERTKEKQCISCEFLGKYHGWTRMTIMPIEVKNGKVKKIVVTTQIIDTEKNEMMNLIYKSTTDEMTRLYNRRMYEDDMDLIMQSDDIKGYVVIVLDVNGLKTVNDTLGHKAGDELIIGASQCIYSSFVSMGKSYRTGGDEFVVIVRCDEERLKTLLADLEDKVKSWAGTMNDSLSISYGYASAEQYPNMTIRNLAFEADKRMYEAKAKYYKQAGIERRKQS